MNLFIQVLFFLLSGAFALGVYINGVNAMDKRITKLERSDSNTKTVMCAMALEVVKDKNKINKICNGGDL